MTVTGQRFLLLFFVHFWTGIGLGFMPTNNSIVPSGALFGLPVEMIPPDSKAFFMAIAVGVTRFTESITPVVGGPALDISRIECGALISTPKPSKELLKAPAISLAYSLASGSPLLYEISIFRPRNCMVLSKNKASSDFFIACACSGETVRQDNICSNLAVRCKADARSFSALAACSLAETISFSKESASLRAAPAILKASLEAVFAASDSSWATLADSAASPASIWANTAWRSASTSNTFPKSSSSPSYPARQCSKQSSPATPNTTNPRPTLAAHLINLFVFWAKSVSHSSSRTSGTSSAQPTTTASVDQNMQLAYQSRWLIRSALTKSSRAFRNEGGKNIERPLNEYKLEWQDNILGYLLVGIAIILPSLLGYAIWEGHKERKLKQESYEPINEADPRREAKRQA
jgi:hypothetical protein